MSNINEKMTALADAVRSKANRTDSLSIDAMTAAVNGLAVGTPSTKSLTVTPTKSTQTFSSSDLGVNTYYSTVTVNAIPAEYITTSDATAVSINILEGKTAYINGGKVAGTMTNVGALQIEMTPDNNYYYNTGGYVSSLNIYAHSESKTFTPSAERQTYTATERFIGSVTVDPIPPEYITTDDATAVSGDILSGKTAYVKRKKVTGTLKSVTATLSGNVVTIPQGVIAEEQTLTVPEAQAPTLSKNTVTVHPGYVRETQTVTVGTAKAAETYTPGVDDVIIPADSYLTGSQIIKGDNNLIPENIAKDITIFGVTGDFEGNAGTDTSDATVTPSDLLAGVTAYGANGLVVGNIETVRPSVVKNTVTLPKGYVNEDQTITVGISVSAREYTPGTADITIPADAYLAGNQTIKGDGALISENIKAGVSIFNVSGTFTSDATATASDIAQGKTAYVKGVKLTGTAAGGEEFYKCTAVHGPQIISFIAVSGAGIADCNGNYSDSGVLKNGQSVYSYASASGTTWYIYFTTSEWEGDSWVLSDNMNVEYAYGAYYYGSSLSGTWWGGEGAGEEAGQAAVSLEYSAVNAGQDKTWSGYKLIAAENGYEVSAELTTGLFYGIGATSDYVNDCITPKVGGIYNSNCTAEICDTQFVTDDALTFTAEEAFSTVKLEGGSNFDWSGIRYSLDGITWQSYTSNTVITLPKIGDFVKFDNTKSTLAINPNISPGGKFKLTGKVAASGELKSMLNYSDYWPNSCFSDMFRNQTALTSCPVVSSATLEAFALDYTFNGCKNIKKAFVKLNKFLPREDDGTYQNVDGMFGACSSLSVIEVDFTSWEGFDTQNGWLINVAPKGVFIKPAALPEEYGAKWIPVGWQVVNK